MELTINYMVSRPLSATTLPVPRKYSSETNFSNNLSDREMFCLLFLGIWGAEFSVMS